MTVMNLQWKNSIKKKVCCLSMAEAIKMLFLSHEQTPLHDNYYSYLCHNIQLLITIPKPVIDKCLCLQPVAD